VTRLVAGRDQVMAVQRGTDVVWEDRAGLRVRTLDQVYGSGVIENYLFRVADDQETVPTPPHPVRTLEHVYVISGTVEVGPVGESVVLGQGDFVRYAGDRPHVYRAVQGEALLHTVISVPRVQPGTGAGGQAQASHG
jgi:mannose-6-phosphate isomerase-like protein (cupin superfamily)